MHLHSYLLFQQLPRKASLRPQSHMPRPPLLPPLVPPTFLFLLCVFLSPAFFLNPKLRAFDAVRPRCVLYSSFKRMPWCGVSVRVALIVNSFTASLVQKLSFLQHSTQLSLRLCSIVYCGFFSMLRLPSWMSQQALFS